VLAAAMISLGFRVADSLVQALAKGLGVWAVLA